MNYIIGLTGGIASGKSQITNIFYQLGVPLVDADIISRQILKRGSSTFIKIVSRWGDRILNPDGKLNRSKLREIIFDNPKEKIWLNSLMHPLIQEETMLQLKKPAQPYLLWVSPLLVENKLTNIVNRVLMVDVCPKTQLQRLLNRDNISLKLAQQMINAQSPREEKLACAHDIIDNNGPIEQILTNVIKLHQFYLGLTKFFKNLT